MGTVDNRRQPFREAEADKRAAIRVRGGGGGTRTAAVDCDQPFLQKMAAIAVTQRTAILPKMAAM